MSTTISYSPSTSGYASSGNGWSTGTGSLIQGSAVYANYYGVAYFDFALIRSYAANNNIVSMSLTLQSHVGYARTVRLYLGQGMAKDTFASGARPTPANGTTYKEAPCAANAAVMFTTTDATWLAALIDSATTCIYINRGDDSASYWECDGAKSGSTAPLLQITWTPKAQSLATPGINSVSAVTADTVPFSWSASSDSSGDFTPSQIAYELNLSKDGGSTWGSVVAVAAGTVSQSVNLRSYFSLATGQYFYSSSCLARVRAKVTWNSTAYYSSYSTSNTYAINYKVVPGAPSTLTPSKSNPYEGESVTFTAGRPATYNAYDHTGAVMGMTYYAQLADGTNLGSASANVSNASATIPYTVGNLTSGASNLATTLKAYCVDAEGQTGPYLSGVAFTIKRFRAPGIIITGISRTATNATVNISVADTGYGGTQLSSQISSVRYNIGSGYVAATLGAWGGSSGALTNSFTISGLSSGSRYSLSVTATNVAPGGTSLSAQTSTVYSMTVYEFTPAAMTFHDSQSGVSGIAAQAGVIGSDFTAPVNAGCLAVQNDISAGGNIAVTGALTKGGTNVFLNLVSAARKILGRLTAGSGAVEEIGLLGSASNVPTAAAAGASGNLAGWDASGNIADAAVAITALLTAGNCTMGGTDTDGYWKFNNGFQVAFKKFTIASCAITTAHGQVYISNGGTGVSVGAFSTGGSTWAAAPTVIAFPGGDAGASLYWVGTQSTGASATNWPSIQIFRGTSATITNLNVNLIAIGHWK